MSSQNNHSKEYAKDDFIVIWKSHKCIHAGECVKRLPKVYNPDERPWIKVDNASVADLKKQIDACPSAALSYKMKGADHTAEQEKQQPMETKVEVMKNGPLLVHGTIEVTSIDGQKEQKSKTTAFCRCGASANKPYCDGTHTNADFQG